MRRFLRQRSLFQQHTLFCFSPPVMLATIMIELGLAILVALRYITTTSRRLIIAILICLAGFQIAEFNVCGTSTPPLIWSRIGYILITLLPPLGIHLATRLRREKRPQLLHASYLVAVIFIAAFAFLPDTLSQGVCTGNYVVFRLTQPLAALYTLYYFGLVGVGMVLTRWPALRRSSAKQRRSLNWLAIGYLAFTIPTIIIQFILPLTHTGIPSIMCGFAILLALAIGLRVAPLADR